MLWYLHVCATAGVVVTGYSDHAVATMTEDASGGGRFTEAVLRPHVTVGSPDMIEKAVALHRDAHEKCFIANSVNFPVRREPVVVAAGLPAS
jgi:organic hydroperoxide reductase OsmC/OhrA